MNQKQLEREVRAMIGFSINDILGVLAKIMNAFKQVMNWLGILVLPDDEDKKYYPDQTTAAGSDGTDEP